MAPKQKPNVAEVKTWFKSEVIPKRTTSAGFSVNRIVKGPRAMVFGNQSDPNGLCGDVTSYVADAYFDKYFSYQTTDGFEMLMLLWEGTLLNHIANVLIPVKSTQEQIYKIRGTESLQLIGQEVAGVKTFNKNDLFGLVVLDLYYKKITTVEDWWKDLDSSFDGLIGIAKESSMDDLKNKMDKL